MSPDANLDPDALAALEEERRFLLRSLEDLEAEHAAGDLDDDDYATLRDDYTVRAAETIRAIGEHRQAFDAAPRRSRGRTIAVFAGVIAFAVVAGLVVAASIGSREAGETATGGISVRQTPTQRAQECQEKLSVLETEGPQPAIECFTGVLEDDPRNVVALTWLGWTIELSTRDPGLSAEQMTTLQETSERLIERAVAVDPRYSYARAFRAIVAYRRGDYAQSQEYLADFEANDPSADARAAIAQMDLEAGIERGLAGAAGSTTTTVPSSTTTGPPG